MNEMFEMPHRAYKHLEPNFDHSYKYNIDASEVWDGRITKRILRYQYKMWLLTLADWKVFVTLTFRDQLNLDPALKMFKRLVRILNQERFKKHYYRYVGDSYFSYALTAEKQLRGDIHFHFVADKPLKFQLIHDTWNDWAGFAHTSIIQNRVKTISYVVKYIVKDGNVEVYKSDWHGKLMIYPDWWIEIEEDDSLKCENKCAWEGDPGEAPA
jgi:hypothetical protein